MESHHLEMVLDLNSFDEIQEYNILMFLRHFLGSSHINMKKGIDPWNRTKILQFYYFDERLYTPHKGKILHSIQPYKESCVLYLEDGDMKKYISFLFPSVVECEKYIVVKNSNIDQIYKLIKKYETRLCFHKNEREIQKVAKYEKIENNFFLMKTTEDKENVNRIRKSELPCYFYHKSTIKEKYYLVKSLIRLSSEKNLPSRYSKFVVDSLDKDRTIAMFDMELYGMLHSPGEENFRSRGFETLEDALVYNIQLSNKSIHGILLPCFMKFYICYVNEEEIESTMKLEEARVQIIKNLVHKFSENYHFYHYDLDYLVSISCENEKPIFMDKIQEMGLHHYNEKDYYIYNFYNDLSTFKKKYSEVDRSGIEIDKSFTLMVNEKIDYIYDIVIRFGDFNVTLLTDYLVEDDFTEFLDEIKIAFRKGYFLTDMGLFRFMTTGTFSETDIKNPDWMKEDYNFVRNALRNIKIKYS